MMDNISITNEHQKPDEEVDKDFMNTQLRRAKKLGILAIDTTDPTLLKDALDAVEEIQPWLRTWVHEQINKRIDKENGR